MDIEHINESAFNTPTNSSNYTFNDALGTPLFTSDIMMAYNIFLYCSIALGVPGNILVIFVFSKIKPSTSTDWFIIFISIVDLICLIINVPIYATFTSGVWKLYGNYIICKLHMFTSQSVALSSTFLICGLSLDRYYKVCRRNSTRLSKKKSLMVCLLTCLITTICSLPSFLLYTNINGKCVTTGLGLTVLAYYGFVFLTFIVATIIVVVCYTKICIVVTRVEKTVRQNQSFTVNSVADNRYCLGRFCGWRRCCCFNTNRVQPSCTQSQRIEEPTTSTSQRNVPMITCSRGVRLNEHQNSINIQDSTNINTLGIPTANRHTSITSLPMQQQRENPNCSHTTTTICFLVCSIFIMSWIPPWVGFVLATIPSLRFKPSILVFTMFGRMTYLINTFSNPILYTWLNRKFRKKVVKCLCFWNK